MAVLLTLGSDPLAGPRQGADRNQGAIPLRNRVVLPVDLQLRVNRSIDRGRKYLLALSGQAATKRSDDTRFPLAKRCLIEIAIAVSSEGERSADRLKVVLHRIDAAQAGAFDCALALLAGHLHGVNRDTRLAALARSLARGARSDGLWTYSVKPSARGRGDIQVSAWVALALSRQRPSAAIRKALGDLEEALAGGQRETGWWPYQYGAADEDAGAYPQGTFIGLVALRAAHEWLEADTASLSRRSRLAARRALLRAGKRLPSDVLKVLKWIESLPDRRSGDAVVYPYHTLAMLFLAANWKASRALDETLWYRRIAKVLAELQSDDGSWPSLGGDQSGEDSSSIRTCLALLCLRRAECPDAGRAVSTPTSK